jgi:hypothetical protein
VDLMQKSETNTDIEIIHSLAIASHSAHWDFRNGRHAITLNLPENWKDAVISVDEWRGSPPHDGDAGSPWNVDDYIEPLIDNLETSFLTELICIERRRQGLRMKRDRCKPCCLARIVGFMANHCHLCIWYPNVKSQMATNGGVP